MLRPIETNLSLFNVEHRANQAKEPNAHQFQVMQQEEISKRMQHEAQSVHPTEKVEAEVKVRERKDDRDKEDGKKKKKKNNSFGQAEEIEEETVAQTASTSSGGLNFLA